jgi:hypothetical protein
MTTEADAWEDSAVRDEHDEVTGIPLWAVCLGGVLGDIACGPEGPALGVRFDEVDARWKALPTSAWRPSSTRSDRSP